MSIISIPHWEQLAEFVSQIAKQRGLPGIALGVLYKGEVAAAGLGVTNVEHPLPVTDDTLFQIGSISKTFTSTAMLRLAEKGRLSLDVPVRTYLPSLRVADERASASVTLRQLLTHMAGWDGDFFEDTGAGDDALARYVSAMAELEQLAPVGAVWSYNNAGFQLAGRVIEVVTGKTFEAAMKELVFDPLGLRQCYYDPRDVMTRRFASGHAVDEEGARVLRPWHLTRATGPGGGIIANVRELLAYAGFHLGDGESADGTRVLASETLAQMHSPQVGVWRKEAWGLGWGVKDTQGVRQVSHGGATVGQMALLTLVPEHQLALAILTNADRGTAINREISRWVLKQFLGIETPDPNPLRATLDELKAYVGRYVRPFAEWELGILAGRLVVQATTKGGFPTRTSPPPPTPPPAVLDLCEPDRLVIVDGPGKGSTADVLRKADGSIGWLRTGGRIHVRQPDV